MGFRENLENGVKSTVKKVTKILIKPLRKFLIIGIAIAIVIISLGASYDALAEEFSKKISEHMKNNPVKYNATDGSIDITDDDINSLVKLLESMGTDINKLKLTKEQLKKIYAAELVTTEINKGVPEIYGKYYGRVYVKRAGETTEELTDMKYLSSLQELETKVAEYNNSSDKNKTENLETELLTYYTVDANGQICFVDSIHSEKKNDEIVSKSATIKKLPYKDKISQFVVPVEFLIDICFISQNPGFTMALADKILNETKINVAILQTKNYKETKTTYKYQIEEYSQQVDTKYDKDGKYLGDTRYDPEVNTSDDFTQVETISSTSISSELKITSVESWFTNLKYSYTRIKTSSPQEIPENDPSNILPNEVISNHADSVRSKPDKNGNYTISNIRTETSKVNQRRRVDIIDDTERYQEGPTSAPEDKTDDIVNMLKAGYNVPGTFNKVSPLGNLESGSGIFFNMLEGGERTQSLEQLMRYILGKASGNDYGVSDLDFSVYNISDFNTISGIYGSSVEDKVWYALKALGYSNETIAGAMGNISCESGFNPTALNSSSGAYGIAQWLGGRRTSLQNYAVSKGKSEEDEDIQIEFLIAELTGTGDAASYATRRTAGGKGENYHTFNDWVDASDTREAAIAYCWFFETPSTEGTKTASVLATEKKRADKAEEYYELYKTRGTGGTTSNSNDGSVRCYYTSGSGRKFTILDQTKIPSWDDCCNRAACAIIASGYSNETPSQLINTKNEYGGKYYGVISGNDYWNRYGLQVTKIDKDLDIANYDKELRAQLVSGGYAVIWINNNQSTYYGKSGVKWTTLYHWVAIVDYKLENGVEKMAVADYRGITWVGLDEFTTHGINHMIFINEK